MTEVAHRRILSAQLGEVHRVEAVHRDLMALMLEGADTATMLEWLAQRLGVALSLVRGDGQLLFHAPAGTHSRQDILDAHACAAARQRAPIALPIPGRIGGLPLRLTLPCQSDPLGTAEREVLTKACELVALSLLRRRQEETLLARERGDFLGGLMNGDTPEHEAETRARELGWTPSALLLPIVIAGRAPRRVREQQDSWAVIMQRAQQELRGYGVAMISGVIDRGEAVAAVVGVPTLRDADRRDQDGRRAEIAREVGRVVRSQTKCVLPAGGAVAACVGESAVRWTDVGARLRELADLAPSSLPEGSDAWLDLGRPSIDLLVKHLLGIEAVERFVDRRLAALEDHDAARNSELVRTLEALFEHNGNKADTARALYLERQSLYSRLERIEELLDESLTNESTRLGLQLALHLRRSQRAAVSS
ncbi:MAG TPA: helix-turn-helix domain-containing protein [Thermoleophilaceae bacterium]